MKKSVSVLAGFGLLLCTASLFAQTGGSSGGTTGGDRPAQQEKPKATEKAKTKQSPQTNKGKADSAQAHKGGKTAPKDPPDSGTNKAMNKTDRPPAKTAVKEKAAAKQ